MIWLLVIVCAIMVLCVWACCVVSGRDDERSGWK